MRRQSSSAMMHKGRAESGNGKSGAEKGEGASQTVDDDEVRGCVLL